MLSAHTVALHLCWRADYAEINRAVELVANAKSPILFTGGRHHQSGPAASDALRELAELSGAPVTST